LHELALGKRYDFAALLKNVIGPAQMSPEAYICSEFAQAVLEHVGLLPPSRTAATPSELPQILPGVLYRVDRDGDPWLAQWTKERR